MKKNIILLSILFLIYTAFVNICPTVTQWDTSVIIAVQKYLSDIPIEIPRFISSQLFLIMLIFPILIVSVFLYKKNFLKDIILLFSTPFAAYGFNYIFKKLINRPRPPIELQLGHHSESCSYVSNHTFVTFCVCGLCAYYIYRYCENKLLKSLALVISVLWVILEGFSRVWLGVHNPTDVIGGYFLGIIFLLIYIEFNKKFSKYS